MTEMGFESYHVVCHHRGARVGHRMALDHPKRVRTFTSLDVVASQAAFDNIVNFFLDFLLQQWTAVDGAITEEAYAEYLRCYRDLETIRGSCMDYRAIEIDLVHDEADRGRRIECQMLLLWAGNMAKRPGFLARATAAAMASRSP